MSELPAYGAWRRTGGREGVEVVFFRDEEGGYRATGQANAVEDGVAWAIGYSIGFDSNWVTRTARIVSASASGEATVELRADGCGQWLVDGRHAPGLDGGMDVDLEASVFTNALPVHRLRLDVEQLAEAPAAYVRVPTPRVERLEQTYRRLPDDADGLERYHYTAPAFEFEAELSYDRYGLLVTYPGIARRIG